jgi:pterin-4a-carbinolamine dehydratase
MANSIFISYRRSDSQHAAFAIADRLRWAFGAEEVFFDRGSVPAGDEWPETLKRGVEAAKVFLAIIGERWLLSADEWGRRRIDVPTDWVRLELAAALAARAAGNTSIIPVLLGNARRLHRDAFDETLQPLADLEPQLLREDQWEEGLEGLIVATGRAAGLPRMVREGGRNPNGSPARPRRVQSTQRSMSDAEVRAALEPLARWQLQWAPHPWGIGGEAQEITKSYDFVSFADAIAFMAHAARDIDLWSPPHHPRWENQWKVINVSFSTWDVDCRVTRLDIAAAKKFDNLVASWNRSGSEPAVSAPTR